MTAKEAGSVDNQTRISLCHFQEGENLGDLQCLQIIGAPRMQQNQRDVVWFDPTHRQLIQDGVFVVMNRGEFAVVTMNLLGDQAVITDYYSKEDITEPMENISILGEAVEVGTFFRVINPQRIRTH